VMLLLGKSAWRCRFGVDAAALLVRRCKRKTKVREMSTPLKSADDYDVLPKGYSGHAGGRSYPLSRKS
jgi:hypothetical protein